MSKRIPLLVMPLSFLIALIPAFAHHGAAVFETKTVTMKGTVAEWFWANPHCLLKYDVKDDNGQVVRWVAETQAPINMIGAGWRKDSFKPGDLVTVTVRPVKSGQPVGAIVGVVFPDGRVLGKVEVNTGADSGTNN